MFFSGGPLLVWELLAMGTRITILFPHELSDWSDRPRLLDILERTLLEARRIATYWPDRESFASDETWVAEPAFPPPYTREYSRFSGPGPLFVEVNSRAVCVSTGARWRGFLSIQPLRSVHIQAFHSLMLAFGANSASCFPEDDFVEGAFWDGGNFKQCCQVLDERYGDARSLIDAIDPDMAAQTDRGCPRLQYRVVMTNMSV